MKASAFIATSLDGFIAREDGSLDWLPEGGGEPHGYDEFMASVDVLILGRHTYETVLSFASWPYGDKPVVVLSRKLTALAAPEGAVCRLMSGPPGEVLARLGGQGFRHAYVDGGITLQGFLQAGLLQRLIVTRVPVLLGAGIPLFGPLAHDLRFEHVATRAYPSGLVQSEYRLAP